MKPVESLYIINIDEVWSYLDIHLPGLLENNYFRMDLREDYSAMVISQLFTDVLSELGRSYIRPPIRPLFEETLYAFYDELKYQLLPILLRIIKSSGITFNNVQRIDYMATRSGMVICTTRYMLSCRNNDITSISEPINPTSPLGEKGAFSSRLPRIW